MLNLKQRLEQLSDEQRIDLARRLGIDRSAAGAKESGKRGKQLAAYVVPRPSAIVDTADLRRHAQEQLPDYMVPAHFILLDELPYTPNGKVDRQAVLQMEIDPQQDDYFDEFVEPHTEVEKTLAAIWEEVLDIDMISIHDGFFELGGDSLMSIQVIARARQEGLSLTPRQLFTEQTIGRLAQVLEAGQQQDTADPILLPLNSAGPRPPLFYAHGIFGDVSSLTNIAPLLHEEQPLYGLQAIGLQADHQPDTSVEQMATHCIEAIKRVQPAGPYHLAGFCFGGVLAYEIARQLEQQGQETAVLAIIESSAPAPYHEKKPFYDPDRLQIMRHNLPLISRSYQEYGGQYVKGKLQRRLGLRKGGARSGADLDGQELEFDMTADFNASRPESQKQLKEINWQAGLDYRPQPYGGQVTLLRARYLHTGHALFGKIDPTKGFGTLAQSGVDIRYVDGYHTGILREPYATTLAQTLSQVLEENS